jgi:raffinose/stachyose/melibiose transport system substrate-binding protein
MRSTLRRFSGATVVAATAALVLSACSSGSGGGDTSSAPPTPTDKVLRVAMTEPGADAQKGWDLAKKQFEAENAGWKVQYIQQNDDIYSTVGLPSLLSGGNAPDVYFEWAGNRLAQRVSDGVAADIGDKLKAAGITDRYTDGAFGGTQVDGKTVMLPYAKDVSNVIWYNKAIFAQQGITPPTTWDELVAVCTKLKAAGITPYAQGNKDLWPAGNWVGHIISRSIGDQAYSDMLNRKAPMNSPEMVAAMARVQQIHDNGWINASVNSISDNEGYTLFFSGKAAMTPIGSWLVGIQQDQAKSFQMGWFNLPSIPGGKGDQASVMGVSTGYVVNAKSAKQDQAIAFFKDLTSDAVTKVFVAAGESSLLKSANSAPSDPLSVALLDLVEKAPTVVAPPDTGYSLKVADALNTATSEILGGASSPQDALDEAQQKVDALP